MLHETETSAPVISLDDIIAVTTQLTHLLAQETLLLKKSRIRDVAELQDEKLKHIVYLEKTKELLYANPSLLLNIPQQKILEFRSISSMFAEVMEENHNEMLKAKQTNKKVLEIMTTVVIEQMQERTGYNQKGTMGNYAAKNGTLPALSFNNNI